MAITFYRGGNSQFLQVAGLKDQSTTPATYVNNATMTGTLYDSTGAPVTGAQNMTGQYVSGSNGIYQLPVDPNTFNPVEGSGYLLVVQGSTPAGAKYEAEIAVTVKTRKKGTET